jgi:hypothetical protein
VTTTTVQGTVYLATGTPGAGTLSLSWPTFTAAGGQLVTAGHLIATIAPDGFLSVNLAPNVGATPAGLYYTATYYMSDGTTSTQYWVVPAAAQANLAQVQAQLMPAAQAVQTVSKAYVDQAITELTGSLLTASGGTLSGPLYLNGDPTQPLQAADKHYVDTEVSTSLPMTGGAVSGELTAKQIGAVYQADQFPGADFGAKVQACVNGLSATYGGTCDARNFAGTLAMGSSLTLATANATILLPCATIATANQVIVTAGTRNVVLHGCALRGASTASGSQGGTVFLYSGAGDQYDRGNERDGARAGSLSDAGDGSGRLVFSGQLESDGHDSGRDRELYGRKFLRQPVRWIWNGGERDRAPGCECGDDRLGECEHVCAVAYRLPDERGKSDCGNVWDQPAAGRWQYIQWRRRGGLRDRSAPRSECAEQYDCGAAQREFDQPGRGGRGQFL